MQSPLVPELNSDLFKPYLSVPTFRLFTNVNKGAEMWLRNNFIQVFILNSSSVKESVLSLNTCVFITSSTMIPLLPIHIAN
jgi:hypothetical protein